jgi:hypothetical protein
MRLTDFGREETGIENHTYLGADDAVVGADVGAGLPVQLAVKPLAPLSMVGAAEAVVGEPSRPGFNYSIPTRASATYVGNASRGHARSSSFFFSLYPIQSNHIFPFSGVRWRPRDVTRATPRRSLNLSIASHALPLFFFSFLTLARMHRSAS